MDKPIYNDFSNFLKIDKPIYNAFLNAENNKIVIEFNKSAMREKWYDLFSISIPISHIKKHVYMKEDEFMKILEKELAK